MTDITWMTNFETTIWYFPKDIPSSDPIHGLDSYPGRFPPTIPKILIQKYSKEGEFVLDPFLGGGTTIIEAKISKRNGIGIDTNSKAIEIANKRLANIKTNNNLQINTLVGDARRLFLKDETIDLIITSPPYWNLIKYSEEKNCLANLERFEDFLFGLQMSIKEMYRVLKPNKWCCIVIGDSIDGWAFYPLGYKIQKIVEEAGFIIQRVIIHIQSRTNSFLFSNKKVKNRVLERGLFLIAHEYIIICQKK